MYIIMLIPFFFFPIFTRLSSFFSDPPKFTETPRSQRVLNDLAASFTCRVTGDPPPLVEWRKNGRRIGGTNRFQVIEVQGGSILRIEPVKYQRDNATYECVAENTAGDTISAKATLEVFSDDREYYECPQLITHFSHCLFA